MPIFAILGWGWIKSVALPLLTGLPRWVWYIIIAAIALMFYTNHVTKNANAKKEAEFQRAQQAEKQRQTTVIEKAVEDASQRARQAELALLDREKDYEAVRTELENLRKTNTAGGKKDVVCLPASISDRVRHNAERGRSR